MRTFAILTTPANELVGTIHDRMPAILAPAAYDRWVGTEPDPRDLLKPFPSALMAIWPISTRVNSPSNDDEHLLDEIELAKEGGLAPHKIASDCGSVLRHHSISSAAWKFISGRRSASRSLSRPRRIAAS